MVSCVPARAALNVCEVGVPPYLFIENIAYTSRSEGNAPVKLCAKGGTMEDPWDHAAMRWFLTIVVFIASFHATWTALEYMNRAPEPTPSLEIPPIKLPGVLVEDRSWQSPIELPRAVKIALAIQHQKWDFATASRLIPITSELPAEMTMKES
jgi:hypothetical protein